MSFISELNDVLSKRKIILSLAMSDFKKKFVGSYFGIFWLFVQPVVTIIIYYCVFQLGFKAEPPSVTDAPYVLWLIPGIVPWFFLNEAINSGTSCLIDYSYLVKKVVFKVSIVPVIKMVSCLFVHLIFIFIMLVVFMLFGYMPSIYWIQIIYYVFCSSILIIGITFITSSINVLFRDMGQIVNIILQFGMWITPIMWPYTLVNDFILKILKLNPVFYIVEGFRDCLLNKTFFWEKPMYTLYYWVIVLILFAFGGFVFKKLKPHFADVL